MEKLPEKFEQVVLNPGQRRNQSKITDLADAMRLANEMLAYEDTEEFQDVDPYGYLQEIENDSGTALLEPEWKASPDDDRWNRRIKARARKAAVARYYLMGYPTNEIANLLAISEIVVKKDIEAVSYEWRRNYLEDIEEAAGKDLARLDDMFNKLAGGIERGDIRSIRAGIEVIKERGSILGYRNGVQVDIETHIRELAASLGHDPEQATLLAQRISVRYK